MTTIEKLSSLSLTEPIKALVRACVEIQATYGVIINQG